MSCSWSQPAPVWAIVTVVLVTMAVVIGVGLLLGNIWWNGRKGRTR